MRVLALADRPFHGDAASLADQHGVDAIVTLGDLQPSWLETLDRSSLPKLGVYGNHDDERYMPWFVPAARRQLDKRPRWLLHGHTYPIGH